MDLIKCLVVMGVFVLSINGHLIPHSADGDIDAYAEDSDLVRRQFLTPTIPQTPATKCPDGCSYEGKMYYCTHVTCHVRCTDAVKLPGFCCPECLNGPNCNKDGHTIPEHQTITVASGEMVTCVKGGNIETQVFHIVG